MYRLDIWLNNGKIIQINISDKETYDKFYKYIDENELGEINDTKIKGENMICKVKQKNMICKVKQKNMICKVKQKNIIAMYLQKVIKCTP